MLSSTTPSAPIPPTLDPFAPERMKGNLCFCGKETIEDHDFCFCSPHCAREDALRALDDLECHYRDVVRRACIKAGVSDLHPRRRMSVEDMCPSSVEERASATMTLRLPRPIHAGHRRNMPTLDTPPHEGVGLASMSGRIPERVFPTLSQITGAVLARKGMTGEQLVSEQRGRTRDHAFATLPTQSTENYDHTPPVISLDVIPLPDDNHIARPALRRVPRSATGLKNNIRKSVAALLNGGKGRAQGIKATQRNSNMGSHENDTSHGETRVFGHPINATVSHTPAQPLSPFLRPQCVPAVIPIRASRTLRRSVSFAGWDAFPQDADPNHDKDPLMQMLAEMREEMRNDEDFDPMSYFDEHDEES